MTVNNENRESDQKWRGNGGDEVFPARVRSMGEERGPLRFPLTSALQNARAVTARPRLSTSLVIDDGFNPEKNAAQKRERKKTWPPHYSHPNAIAK